MKRFAKLLPLIILAGCASPKEAIWEPAPRYTPAPRTMAIKPIKSNNWFVEKKSYQEDIFVTARSMESEEYMWMTCKIEPTGITGLSLGIVQPDDIGYRGDPATIIFMVNGREVIYGPGIMVNQSRGGLRSFDPRGNRFASEEERAEQVREWWNDPARIAQYEVIEQMRKGDHIFAEIKLDGIRREVRVDLTGFPYAADEVLAACDKSDVPL